MSIRFPCATALVALSSLAFCGAVATAGSPPPTSAIQQYVEVVPSSTGAEVPSVAHNHVRALPRTLQERITSQAGSDAAALTKIATSSSLGAPRTPVPRTRFGHRAHAEAKAQAVLRITKRGSVASSLLVGGRSDAALRALVVAFVATLVIAAAAIRRHG